MEKLLLVTNLAHEDRWEDLFLAERLADLFDLTIGSPASAVPLLAANAVDACFIRNAWPSKQFAAEFAAIASLSDLHKISTYNPLVKGRRGPVENKAYLVNLFGAGFQVIPSFATPVEMAAAGYDATAPVLAKPIDGCSSVGIIERSLSDMQAQVGAYIFQPRIAFAFEVSFYFIDGHYGWAMRSAGATSDARWSLSAYEPMGDEIEWAKRFVQWNQLPYGIQRIDAARLADGSLLLMEVEDSMPMLSLADMDVRARDAAVKAIVESVYQRTNTMNGKLAAGRIRDVPIGQLVSAINQ